MLHMLSSQNGQWRRCNLRDDSPPPGSGSSGLLSAPRVGPHPRPLSQPLGEGCLACPPLLVPPLPSVGRGVGVEGPPSTVALGIPHTPTERPWAPPRSFSPEATSPVPC